MGKVLKAGIITPFCLNVCGRTCIAGNLVNSEMLSRLLLGCCVVDLRAVCTLIDTRGLFLSGKDAPLL